MKDFTGLITVRTGSSRLPAKCLLKIQDKSILECVIDRALKANIVPIVCTTELPEDNIIQEIAESKSVLFFRGSVNNKIKRWFDCSMKFNLKYFHTIDADDPFFDEELVKLSISKLIKEKLDFVAPSKYSSKGAASVGYSFKSSFLKEVIRGIDNDTDTEMINNFIENDKYLSKEISEKQILPYQIRLTLDYEEDYWMIITLSRILGINPARRDIIQLFKKNPNLHNINFFRNNDWEEKQKLQIKSNRKNN